ncbi:Diguanylate cyclase [Candidatus Accumulibacter aalborgensis]|uniref:diguanylate cyclase n=1 Tax=Candidatus Accumulibacter aalborgensis TaxID=1860102 RepID=A0A1A8XTZ1_9PROT|nr:sensor domain-containing diguanylate cyclase [Candidatus Accumulibacter aalborgensis]SBT08022.1 Diguanylate cyclase [Candidatus Accumulibacter aalborgensis]
MKSLPADDFTSRWRIGTVLLWLVLACLLPGMLGVAVLFSREYLDGRAQLERDMIARARAMVQSVDTQLFRAKTAGQALATSGVLARNDLAGFHRWGREVIATTKVGTNFVLSDESGQQLVNTLRECGEPLPRHGNPEILRRVFATGQPVISGIYIGGLLNKPIVSVELPVIVGGKVKYALSTGLLPGDFDTILTAQGFPPGWIAAIFDHTGTIAARTLAPEEFVGQKGTAEFIERFSESLEGSMKTVTLEGIPTLSVWSRSSLTGWTVGIGIPRDLLERDLMYTMTWLASGLATLLVVGLFLAWLAAQKIAGSVRALTDPAIALGKGELVAIPDVDIRESAEVAVAIRQAAELLAERTAALLAANRELEQLARVDTLTGLQNRNSANERLRLEFLRWKRSGNPYAVLFMDIDYFKEINDSCGHETGDQVLRHLAGVLKGSLRESDFVARYGGEEFLAIVSEPSAEGALTIAEIVRGAIAKESFPVVGQVTVSIGVAMALGMDKNEAEALRRADTALYQAKENGRNRVRSC